MEPYTGFIDEGIAMLEDLGYQLQMLDIAKVEEPVLIQELESAACVCISGGNTFYLLQELKKEASHRASRAPHPGGHVLYRRIRRRNHRRTRY